ncbi:hypothetical protein CAQU_12155 [Corynebacterium aquilae DSM 44791]|uniref:Uncharacterized protein n=1 Tax=Corynebacterium aquilae DSM 44791 TaxID=1431546 RepID=A0A1L7CIM6_9CORY|nr:hypothetical protein CAQU_12155 [Corynebacterium aquilae DSM 44791]
MTPDFRALNADIQLPSWAANQENGFPTLQKRFFKQLIAENELDSVIAVGLSAADAATNLGLGLEIDVVLSRGECDFSPRRKNLADRFHRVVDGADRLWFDDTYEMDKAVAQGSTKPHLLTPIAVLKSRVLKGADSPSVVAFFPDDWTPDAVEHRVQKLRNHLLELSDISVDVTALRMNVGYTRGDLSLGRGFPGALQYRVPKECTHAIFYGDAPASATMLAAFHVAHPHRVFVEETLGNADVANRLGIPEEQRGRGAALDQRLAIKIAEYSYGLEDACDVSETPAPTSLLQAIEKAKENNLPWWYEQTQCEPSFEQINVFFSAAPIENRTNGARPMRIRSMAEAATQKWSAVRLTSNERILERRGRAINAMLLSGAQLGMAYLENSTSPMLEQQSRLVSSLFRSWKAQGLKIAWFVRDLHWLSKEAPIDEEIRGALIGRGISELQLIKDVADVVYAPSRESAQIFDELLDSSSFQSAFEWRFLPPAVAAANALNTAALPKEGGVELVYSGGYGGIYTMPKLFEELRGDSGNWSLTMIIRPEDEEKVRQDTSDLPPGRVSIRTGNFGDFIPLKEHTVGLVLLESDYARNSFPFKVMSYIEKGITPLCYSGTAVSSFVTASDVGVAVEDKSGELAQLIKNWSANQDSVPLQWDQIHQSMSWEARLDSVAHDLKSR